MILLKYNKIISIQTFKKKFPNYLIYQYPPKKDPRYKMSYYQHYLALQYAIRRDESCQQEKRLGLRFSQT